MDEKIRCDSCREKKERKDFQKKMIEGTRRPLCVTCLNKKYYTKFEKFKMMDTNCMKCGKYVRAQSKWVFCEPCRRSDEFRDQESSMGHSLGYL